MFSAEYPAVTSFRDDAVELGIQTDPVMPGEGVDADCVWIDPALAIVWDGLFPQGLDSGAPCAGARFPGMTNVRIPFFYPLDPVDPVIRAKFRPQITQIYPN